MKRIFASNYFDNIVKSKAQALALKIKDFECVFHNVMYYLKTNPFEDKSNEKKKIRS